MVGVLALGLTGCDVRTEVLVDVDEAGSGTVTVSAGLDADAVDRLPSLDDLVMVDDLDDAGWSVTGPDRDDDGITWIRAEKGFASPDEANAILADISGPEGPFRDLTLSREMALARTRLEFDGTVDLTGGLTAFSDAALTQSLEGHPLGETVEQIEARLGEPMADVFSFELVVRMPGDVDSNAPSEDGRTAVWSPSLSDTAPTDVTASTEVWRPTTVIAVAVGALALILLLVWLVVWIVGRRRRRRADRETVEAA